ncbi:hypothetical protein ACO0OL_002738 [Hanseniaspora opuntiae]
MNDQVTKGNLAKRLEIMEKTQKSFHKQPPPIRITKQFKQRSFIEVFRFGLCVLTPILAMLYVGVDTKDKFSNWKMLPEKEHTVTELPKNTLEIEYELSKLRKERLERRLKLQERLINEFGVEDFESEKKRILGK